MAYNLAAGHLDFNSLSQIIRKNSLLEIALASEPAQPGQLNPEQEILARQFLEANAVAFGPELPTDLVRLILLFQVYGLHAQASPDLTPAINRIMAFFNREVYPIIPETGAEAGILALLSLPLTGAGMVKYQGYELKAVDVMDIFSWKPIIFSPALASALLNTRAYSLARVADILLTLQFELPWYYYLAQVMEGISADDNGQTILAYNGLAAAFNNLLADFDATLKNISGENYPELNNSLNHLLVSLLKTLRLLGAATTETFANLGSTSEPPATSSFSLATVLTENIIQKTTGLPIPSGQGEIIGLCQQVKDALNAGQQLVALAFWAISQVGKVFNLAEGNLTLQAYYHSEFFVPKEMVSVQLEKTINFIRTTTPAALT